MTHIYSSLVILMCLFAHNCESAKGTFSITKSYLSDSQRGAINLGKLFVIQEDKLTQAYLQSNTPTFLTKQQLKRGTIILAFKDDSSNNIFKTAVESIVSYPHSQKIMVLLSSTNEIMGINYVQTKIPNQDISADVTTPQRGADHIFKTQPLPKKQQQETFFQKYKWPLIIGGVVLYMTMNGNQEKGPEGQQAGGAPRQ